MLQVCISSMSNVHEISQFDTQIVINVMELKLGSTTSVPKSVLHLVLVDKGQVPLSGIGGLFYSCSLKWNDNEE